jgi:hypothetical protein
MKGCLTPEALEEWVRRRLVWYADDPWTAAIGAAARLMDAGMTADEAVATVVRIVRSHEASR